MGYNGGGGKAGVPHKLSMTVRTELERRGIDLVQMQMSIFEKAMNAYDIGRGCSEGGEGFGPTDTGAYYLRVANQAVATLAKYAYPTMTAIRIEEADQRVADKVIDATKVRETILNDPFAARASAAISNNADTGLPVLTEGKKYDSK